MKTKIFLMLIMAAALLFSCQKEKTEPVAGDQEVSFSATLVQPDLKNSEDFLPCKTEVATHASILINGVYYYPQVFTIGTELYTQAIKLPAGAYTITDFFLYYEGNGTPGYQVAPVGDIITYATPADGSAYEVYLNPDWDLPYAFTVDAFAKKEINIEVLCFVDLLYQNFGFFWFDITEIIIREQCFFGDFCIKHAEDYDGSSYENQSGYPLTGGYYDAPAIVEIVVEKLVGTNWVGVPGSPFTNNFGPNWGVGAPVCIEYPDVVGVTDYFRVTLKILVKVGDSFVFKTFKVWEFTDGFMIVPPAPAGDGIVDFVLGTCNLTPTDLQLPPYQNLPVTADINIIAPGNPGYWDLWVNSVSPAGNYDLLLNPFNVMPPVPSWCGDAYTGIGNGNYIVNVYGSLTDVGWPGGMPFDLATIAKVNWLFNHLANYGMNFSALTQAQGTTIQHAVWLLIHGTYPGYVAGADPVSETMASDAATHGNYLPLPGGWAAVLFVAADDPDAYQLVFVLVDP